MPRRIIFAIRSKFGDTLISYAAVRAYADAHPQDHVTLLTRKNYAELLQGEAGVRVIGFDSRAGMLARLWWLRLSEAPFDVLGVLFGSGAPIAAIGRWVRARRKIAWSKRFAPELFEEGRMPADHAYIEPAMSVVHAFAPEVVTPGGIVIPSLAARYAAAAATRPDAVGIVPLADELRRNLDLPALLILLAEARRRHPQANLRIYVNPAAPESRELMRHALPPNCAWVAFRDLRELLDQYMQLRAWYGTDTGLFHLAAAVGLPATVFFGPTQPHKAVLCAQPAVTVVRLRVLGESHCDEKSCTRPCCLHQAVADFAGQPGPTPVAETPIACPLRAHDTAALDAITVNTRP